MVMGRKLILMVAIKKANFRMENYMEWANGGEKARMALGGLMKVTWLQARSTERGSE